MTTVDVDITSQTGTFRVHLAGGIVGQGSYVFHRLKKAVAQGRAEGDVGLTWASSSVPGSLLLELLRGVGNVPRSLLRGYQGISEEKLLSQIEPESMYDINRLL